MTRAHFSKVSRLRAGFTLIELITYLSLLSISLTMLMSFELSTQQSLRMQALSNDVSMQADKLQNQLKLDITAAESLTIQDSGQVLVVQLNNAKVVYKGESETGDKSPKLTRIVQSKQSQEPKQPYRAIHEWSFRRDELGLVHCKTIYRLGFRKDRSFDKRVDDWTFRSLVGLGSSAK